MNKPNTRHSSRNPRHPTATEILAHKIFRPQFRPRQASPVWPSPAHGVTVAHREKETTARLSSGTKRRSSLRLRAHLQQNGPAREAEVRDYRRSRTPLHCCCQETPGRASDGGHHTLRDSHMVRGPRVRTRIRPSLVSDSVSGLMRGAIYFTPKSARRAPTRPS